MGKVVMIATLIAAASGFQNIPANPPSPSVQRSGDSAKVLNALNELRNDVATLKKQNWIRDIGPSAVALLALAVSFFVSIASLNRNAQLTRETLQSKSHEEERKAIRAKRDRFYGPYIQLRGVSKHLRDIFTARRTSEEQEKYADKDGKFRTLIALRSGHVFEGIDRVLLDEILRIGKQTERLIMKEIGLVDDAELQDGLSKAAAHFRLIQLAAAGKLHGAGDEIDGFTFPYYIDRLVNTKIQELDVRLRELQSIPMRRRERASTP